MSKLKSAWLTLKQFSVGMVGYVSAPAFLIIGAQKAGTTALFAYLDAHPQIVKGAAKEMHFFDNHFDRGTGWYHARFPLPAALHPDKITYEATPKYLYDPNVPARIHDYNPSIKLIALLRNPIDRAFSAWNVPGWNKFGYESFDAMAREQVAYIAAHGTGYPGSRHVGFLHRGLYADQLKRYFELFPREQLLILESGELRRDPVGTMNRVTAFIGLKSHDWSQEEYHPANKGIYTAPMTDETRALLSAFFRPHNERLYAMLGVDYDWD